MRTLFNMARHYSPSIVFFDEVNPSFYCFPSHKATLAILVRLQVEYFLNLHNKHTPHNWQVDAVMSTRGGNNEHEASRRVKNEIFSQMDGLTTGDGKLVMVLATTNCPWDLDPVHSQTLFAATFRLHIVAFKCTSNTVFVETNTQFCEYVITFIVLSIFES